MLTSDGTNWSSSAPASGNSLNGFVNTFSGNPADSTTYYLAQSASLTTNTAATTKNVQFYIPFSCTLTKVYGSFAVSIPFGSSENITIFVRVNNTTNINVTTTFKLNAATTQFSNSALSISLSAGDYISIGFTGPAWATNPLSVIGSVGWST